MTDAPAAAAPIAIELGDGELVLRWNDGALSRLSHRALRAACPCAWCRARRLRGEIPLPAADVAVARINPQGYGAQLVFNDGHDRGIYPWRYLRGL